MNATTAQRFSPEQHSVFCKLGVWSNRTLADYVEDNAQRDPGGLCVSDGHSLMTFAQARDRAWAVAGSLAGLGVARGDRVMVQLPNSVDAAIVYYALARLGAVFVPRMMIYREKELEETLAGTEAVAVITVDSFRNVDHAQIALSVARNAHSVREVVVLGEAPDGTVPYGQLLTGAAYTGAPPEVSDPHVILFTSGSTGRAKGVLHNFNTYSACARGLIDVLGLDASDRCFTASPIMAQTGLNAGIVAPAIGGFGTVIQDIWDPAAAFELIDRYSCTHAYGAATFITTMASQAPGSRRALPSLRVWGCGGAPVPPMVIEKARTVLGCRVMTMYGQSEACLQTATRLDDSDERVRTSDGRAVPGMEVVVLGESDEPLPTGSEGEICSRGPSVMLAYWGDDAATAAAFDQQGWFHSGDLGCMDEDGYLRVTGRKKDIIIRGGVKISAREIEDILGLHDQVLDVAVIGVPDADLGERVCACVVPTAGSRPGLADLVAFMERRKIAKQKLPERLVLCEELPRTPTGKVQKFALRESAAQQLHPRLTG
jgi:acyl-CoA synthetase (AMP-forming)/AMP-acid ligase II